VLVGVAAVAFCLSVKWLPEIPTMTRWIGKFGDASLLFARKGPPKRAFPFVVSETLE
jgi:hypothetical protein